MSTGTGREIPPDSFPQRIVLCGVGDLKDYRIHASSEKEIITGGSCFNIKANLRAARRYPPRDG